MADRLTALLLLSRQPETLDFPCTDLAHLLQCETDRCRPLLQGKAVRLELVVQEAVTARGRPELMAMAVGNLIRNACQYTEEGCIRVTLERQRILVRDSGPGVPESIRAQVFRRFVRADSGVAGTGLGLAIVQRVCEHLGWSVQLHPSEAGGACFELTLAAGAPHRDAART
jgi:signal transduction histidine kinase